MEWVSKVANEQVNQKQIGTDPWYSDPSSGFTGFVTLRPLSLHRVLSLRSVSSLVDMSDTVLSWTPVLALAYFKPTIVVELQSAFRNFESWQEKNKKLAIFGGVGLVAYFAWNYLKGKQRPAPGGETRCVLVTGAASGIGRATAKKLEALGYHVAALDMNEAGLVSLEKESPLGRIHSFKCDISSAETCERVKEQVETKLREVGATGLTGMANVAAFMPQYPAAETTESDMRKILSVNCEGPVRLCRIFMPLLLKTERPSIVNVASITAHQPMGWGGLYGGTKAFVCAYTQSLRCEALASGLKLNSSVVIPGFIDTPMTTVMVAERRKWCEANKDSPFYPGISYLLGLMEAVVPERKYGLSIGLNKPEDVAQAIVQGLTAWSPQAVYYVMTKPFLFWIWMRRTLPEWPCENFWSAF